MTGFRHRRKLSSGVVIWTGYVVAWGMVVGSGVATAALWWLAGTTVFGLLWLVTARLDDARRRLAPSSRAHEARP